MERMRRTSQLWNWLPAFRAVAETEHLPTAAEQLFVTPPALSRTVKLLEDNLGHPLFRRTGRRLELNDAGELLLRAVRDAMRRVHDGVLAVEGGRLAGPLHVSAAGVIATTWLMPGLVSLRREHPQLQIEVTTIEAEQLVDGLLQGLIDVAFLSVPLAHAGLTTVRLGEASNGVYCGPGHPLYDAGKVTLEQVLEHEFAAPTADSMGRTPEGWPTEVPRRVAWIVDRIQGGLEICATGACLAILPDILAERHPTELSRLPLELIPPTPLLALHRDTLDASGRAELAVAAVKRVMYGGSEA